MKTEAAFLEWLGDAKFYIGWTRYAQFGDHEFVIGSSYCEDENLEEYINDLDGGDAEALDAAEKIKEMMKGDNCFIDYHKNPAVAMEIIVSKMRKYYFEALS